MKELSSPTPQSGWTTVVNENFDALSDGVGLYAEKYDTTTGLVWGYYGGPLSDSVTIPDGVTSSLANATTVYAVMHRTTGALTHATTTTNWNDVATYGRVRRFVTGASSITSSIDWRFLSGGIFDRSGVATVDADDVTYTPTTLADWDGAADPGDVEQALDQLAERITDVESAGSSPSVAARYTIDLASQADSDPGLGKLRFNNATPSSATKIFLDDETSDGVDMSTALLDLGNSGYIRIQSALDVGEWLLAKWNAITDDTGYFDIAITVLATKGTLDDTDAVLLTFDAKGSGGGSLNTAIVAHGNTGATETFDASAGYHHTATLDANCTFTLTGATNAISTKVLLELLQDATGGRTVTWPGSVEWPRSGVAPTLQTGAGEVDFIELLTHDGGTTWFGFHAANGIDGDDGVGVPAGGTAGQVLEKIDGTNYNTQWATPNPLAAGIGAKATRSTTQSINSASWTVINWDAEEYDTTNFHDNATNNNRLTIPTTGRYLVLVGCSFASSATGIRAIQVNKNTTTANSGVVAQAADSGRAGISNDFQCVAEIALTAGDWISVNVYQDSGGALNFANSLLAAFFIVRRVG